ncbi:MAG: electron transport complex subunit RsxC [Fusobacteria bacterium]|nr:electron transport complex subunit RsxC [Fusobacteriota bacterium]
MVWKFKGGVHPADKKEFTQDMEIETQEPPTRLYFPLLQHIGSELTPLVKIGARVKIGQKLAECERGLATPIHSSVSGYVRNISRQVFPLNGVVETIEIENDFKEEWIELEKFPHWYEISREKLIEIIREKGIVGKGGATFPTYAKLSVPSSARIETLIINGAECEPYLTSDYRVMMEYTQKVIGGVKILGYILGVKKIIFGIEKNKPHAIELLRNELHDYDDIEIIALPTRYPQGGEKQLIKALTGKELSPGKLPYELGIVVQNITTAKYVFEGVVEGIPMIDTVITLSGEGYNRPTNVLARLGSRFKDVVKMVEIDHNRTEKLIMGGPMMGIAQYSVDLPIIKGTTGILALSKYELNKKRTKSCISCGRCIKACPMNLHPLEFVKLVLNEEFESLENFHIMKCIDCGCCTYICPSNRPLVETIKLGKSKIRELNRK